MFLSLPNFPNDIYRSNQPEIMGPEIVCDTLAEISYHVDSYCEIPDYEWFYSGGGSINQIASDTILFHPGNPGIDTLIVSYSTACGDWSDTLLIQVNECTECNIEFSLVESDTLISFGETAFLRLQSNAESITLRALPDGVPMAIETGRIDLGEPFSDVCYEIHFMIGELCDSVHVVCVQVTGFPDIQIYIPNAFSPNGDGVNDVFSIFSGNELFELAELEIFDRYGSKMFACQGIECAWDGRYKGHLVQPGVYIYVVKVNTPEGVKIRSGEVLVLR